MQANQKNTIIDNIIKNRKDLYYISDFVYSTFKQYNVYDPEVLSWIKINAGLNSLGIVYTLGEPIPELPPGALKQATKLMVEDDEGIRRWKKVNDALYSIKLPTPSSADKMSEFIRVLADPSLHEGLGYVGWKRGGKPSKRRKSSRRKSYKKRNTKKKKTKRRRRRTKRR